MSVTVTNLSSTAKKVYNPKHLYMTPFVNGVKGEEVLDLTWNMVRDTVSIVQDDKQDNPTENEFVSEYIINSVIPGSYKFEGEFADMQSEVMEKLAGFNKQGNGDNIKVYAPDGYKELFVEIALVFETGGKNIAAILPKVQLDSTVVMQNIKTSVGRVKLPGTGYNLTMTEGSTTITSPFYIDYNYTLPVTTTV